MPRRGQRRVAAAAILGLLAMAAPAQQAPPDPRLSADPLLGFAEIPAGPFVMGAAGGDAFDNERWSRDAAEGTVVSGAYYLARHETTVAQFAVFARATGWAAEPRALQAPDDYPVTFVSWTDAVSYCRWLGATLKASPGTPAVLAGRLREGWRVTLPTEAEWEKAARGGDRRIYPWGDSPRTDRATFGTTAPTAVGRMPCPECPYGLTDMSGNVWEWTRSPFQPYPYDPTDDRTALDGDALWVIRGGHFGDAARLVRATVRGGAEPGARRPFIGFRVAITPTP